MLWTTASLAYAEGSPGTAVEAARRCLAIGEKLDNDSTRVHGSFALGKAYLTEGRYAEARDVLRASASFMRERRTFMWGLPWVLAVLAEAHLALGEHTEALAAAREGIDRGRVGGCVYLEASAQIALIQILLAANGDVPRQEIEGALGRRPFAVAPHPGTPRPPRRGPR